MPKRVQERLAELSRLLDAAKREQVDWHANPNKRGGPQANAIRSHAVREWTAEQERLIKTYG